MADNNESSIVEKLEEIEGVVVEGNETEEVKKEGKKMEEVKVEERGQVNVEASDAEEAKPTGLKFWAAFLTVGMGMFFSGYVSLYSL
jgi:hypothetical protein